jgi:hypothetical protein
MWAHETLRLPTAVSLSVSAAIGQSLLLIDVVLAHNLQMQRSNLARE